MKYNNKLSNTNLMCEVILSGCWKQRRNNGLATKMDNCGWGVVGNSPRITGCRRRWPHNGRGAKGAAPVPGAEMTAQADNQPKYCWYHHGETYHVYVEELDPSALGDFGLYRGPKCGRYASLQGLHISDSPTTSKRPCKKCFRMVVKRKPGGVK